MVKTQDSFYVEFILDSSEGADEQMLEVRKKIASIFSPGEFLCETNEEEVRNANEIVYSFLPPLFTRDSDYEAFFRKLRRVFVSLAEYKPHFTGSTDCEA